MNRVELSVRCVFAASSDGPGRGVGSYPSATVRKRAFDVALAAACCLAEMGVAAQSAPSPQNPAPSQVTPRDIAPSPKTWPQRVLPLPETEAQALPADPAFSFDAGDAIVDGAFDEMADANAAYFAAIHHRHVTLAGLFAAARQLEQAYADRGYILVRVSVPPQRLSPGTPVRVVVIDGFVEDLDVDHVAQPIRLAVLERLRPLVGRHHLTQGQIERALLLAGDLAGARLRSALSPGRAPGGVRLMVEGAFARFEGALGMDNSLPAALGQWQFTGNMAVNGPLENGDQLYVSAGSEAAIGRYGFPKSALGMVGAGYLMPLDRDGTMLTGEYLTSRTQPTPQTGVPLSVGNYTRAMLRLHVALERTREQSLNLTSSCELVTQSQKLPMFGTQISRDQYLAGRLGLDWQRTSPSIPLELATTISQGLGGRDSSAALPTSRQGANADFKNLEVTGQTTLQGPYDFSFGLTARGKTSFGKPLFLSEQFALDAPNAVSSFPGGSFNVDSGATLRVELRYPPKVLGQSLTLAPYVFGARGWGWLANPTAVERGFVTAGCAGIGIRLSLDGIPLFKGTGATAGVEFGHQVSDAVGRANGDRASLTAGFRF